MLKSAPRPSVGNGDHADRPTEKRGEGLLHDRCKEAVKVEVKLFDGFTLTHRAFPGSAP